jgi:hypothetical protein
MEWEIRKAVPKSEPETGKLYYDADGDLFLYLGDDGGRNGPWLEYGLNQVDRRVSDYPNGPLLELPGDEWADAISTKLRGY